MLGANNTLDPPPKWRRKLSADRPLYALENLAHCTALSLYLVYVVGTPFLNAPAPFLIPGGKSYVDRFAWLPTYLVVPGLLG